MRQTHESQVQRPLDLAGIHPGNMIYIDMNREHTLDEPKRTMFKTVRVAHSGLPVVDIWQTAEGFTDGPEMYFLGSVASRAALQEDPDNLYPGLIVPKQQLVVRGITGDKTPIILPNTVRSYRIGKTPGKKRYT